MICMGNNPTRFERGSPAGRQNPVGSSMPLLLKNSRTFFAAQGWYGAGSRTSWATAAGGAAGSRPVPPTPSPEFASSQLPRRVLPPCQTPVRSGFPSDVRTRPRLASEEAGLPPGAAVCAERPADSNAPVTSAAAPRRIIAPPPREWPRHRLCPLEGRRTTSFRRQTSPHGHAPSPCRPWRANQRPSPCRRVSW